MTVSGKRPYENALGRIQRFVNERHIAVEALQQIRNNPHTSGETREAVVSVLDKMKELSK